MQLRYLKIILIISIIISSCSKLFYNSEGEVRPKKSKFLFSKSNFSLHTNDKIDTAVLYLRIERNMALSLGRTGNAYKFYRFYKDGRFQLSDSYENFENHIKFQNINSGIIGYYKLRNDTLRCEFFAPTNGGEYVLIDGVIKNGIIILTKMYPRHNGGIIKLNDSLIKTSINTLSINPNW